MRGFWFIINFCLVLTQILHADGFKKYAGEFMNLGAGSKIMAMGGAGTATADDATASYWNPAALRRAEGLQLHFTHAKQFISSIQHDFVAVSHPLDQTTTLGISLQYFTVNGIKDSRQALNEADNKVDYSKVTTFNTGDYTLLLSMGRSYKENWDYGINVKFIYRDYHIEHAFGLGFDFGVSYRYGNHLFLGVVVKDLTSTMILWSTGEREHLAPSLRLGAAYMLEWAPMDLTLQPAIDLHIMAENRSYASQAHLGPLSLDSFWGMEVEYKNLLALRAGWDDLQRFNTGIGLQLSKLRFDYSFTSYQSQLGNIHRISCQLNLSPLFL